GGRCGDRAAGPGKNGLVAVAIRWLIVALDIRRQGHVTDRVDDLVHRASVFGPQPDRSTAVKPAIEDLAVERAPTFEDDPRSGFQLLARVQERLPLVAF